MLASRGTLRRFFAVTDDAGKLIQLIREIDQLVRRFQVTCQYGHVLIFLSWHLAR